MATTITHAVSASWIAVTVVNVQPDETGYLLTAVLAASLLDLDHLLSILRDRHLYRDNGYVGNLHHARTPLHELFGLLIMGIVTVIFSFIDKKAACLIFIAFTIHLVQDWFMGRSRPFIPLDKTDVQFFTLSFRQKAIIDVLSLLLFGALWIQYLIVPR